MSTSKKSGCYISKATILVNVELACKQAAQEGAGDSELDAYIECSRKYYNCLYKKKVVEVSSLKAVVAFGGGWVAFYLH